MTAPPTLSSAATICPLPRVTIQFCTQCKWLLRAAYYAQELLSTFSTALGEVALQPSTGGTFIVSITHAPAAPAQQHHDTAPGEPEPKAELESGSSSSAAPAVMTKVLWDRRTDGGFPETKELKRRVRDVVEPHRNLGHVDRDHAPPAGKRDVVAADDDAAKKNQEEKSGGGEATAGEENKECEDCK
ncbi:Rdx family-domain-containing protein [Mariannaea sp. PMI_226]|nr:Rdx family-domain-containing protein [Mariannaea sp. PMI_226]